MFKIYKKDGQVVEIKGYLFDAQEIARPGDMIADHHPFRNYVVKTWLRLPNEGSKFGYEVHTGYEAANQALEKYLDNIRER